MNKYDISITFAQNIEKLTANYISLIYYEDIIKTDVTCV